MEKAAQSLALAAVSPIITKLGNKAASFFGGDITPKEFDDLKTTILPKIKAVIKVANKISTDELRPWLMKLKAAVYEAEDVMDEYEYNNINNKVSSLPIPLKKLKGKVKELFGELLLKTTLKKSLEKLRESADEADKLIPLLGVISQTDAQPDITNKQYTTVSGLSSPVFGRDQELKSLINLLIDGSHDSSSSDINNKIHAICGVGGAGKTTLAQYFYNSERVAAHFDLKVWVHASSNFNAIKITKEIIESALEDDKSAPYGNLDVLQKKVKEILKSKTCLLVLDDIWCEDRRKWDEFLIPFNGVENNESRILITTRTEYVASMLGIKSTVSLNELKTEDCRSILKHYAFGGESKYIQDPYLQDVAEKIVQKLKYSPLAARVIGCSLGQKVNIDDWKMILKDDLLKDTKDTLLLSFYHLPSHLQRCFAFCSLYPKGFHFEDVDDLVRLWIVLGFVQCPNNIELTLEERGRQYFNDLVSYSFFQSHESYANVHVIHDLLHDLAEEVSKDDCLRIEGDGSVTIPKTIMHLSIKSDNLHQMPDIFMLDNLRTFMMFSSLSDEINLMIGKKIFENFRKLRVLGLGEYSIQECESLFSQLKHLRYLKAGKVRKLSKSFCSLYHLRFVNLVFDGIDEVPKSFNNLINLRRVIYSKGRGGEKILQKVSNIGKLTSLQELDGYHVNRNAEFGLEQLKNLNQLRSLGLECLENVNDGTEAAIAKLKDRRNLESLTLGWSIGDEQRNSGGDEDVLEGFKPHSNLKQLKIKGYQGGKLPKWWMLENQCYLHILQSLKLKNCSNLLEMFSFPHGLQYLHVNSCPQLKNLAPFPSSVVKIKIIECPNIENLPWSTPGNYDNDDDDDDDDKKDVNQRQYVQNNEEEEEEGRQKQQTSPTFLSNTALHKKFEYLSELWVFRLPLITCFIVGPSQLTALKLLYILECENVRYLEGIGSLPFLEDLWIQGCPELTRLGNLHPLPSLKHLNICGCPKLTERVAGYPCLASFKGLAKIDEPLLLPVLFEEQGLNSLTSLMIHRSQDISFSARQEDMLQHLTSLSYLFFIECDNLACLPGNLEKLSSLQSLDVYHCNQLKSLPTLPASLESLQIMYCSQMLSLPELPISLKSLYIIDCHPPLHENYRESGPLHHKIAHIPIILV